jgi:hypothetical protein
MTLRTHGACCLFAFPNTTDRSLAILPWKRLRYIVVWKLLFHCCANEGIQQWRTIQLLRYRGILICHIMHLDVLDRPWIAGGSHLDCYAVYRLGCLSCENCVSFPARRVCTAKMANNRCCSCRLGETMYLNCGHQRAKLFIPRITHEYEALVEWY